MPEKLQLLIRSDDLGYTEAVNHGLAKVLRYGMTKSVGVMTNMPAAPHGLELVAGLDISIGQHTNICAGKPVSDPERIPSLVGPDGNFKTSREYRSAAQDLVVLEEAITEIEAQYQSFRKLVGREPDYFEGHAIRSANFIRGLEIVAERHSLKYSSMGMYGQTMTIGKGTAYRCAMHSMEPDYDPVARLKEAVQTGRHDMPNVFVCHPGYVDAPLLRGSSLTLNRTREVEMLTNDALMAWLEENGVELVAYSQVGN